MTRRRGMLLVEALFGLLVLVMLGLVAYGYLYRGFSDGVDLARRGHADILARNGLDRFANLPPGDLGDIMKKAQLNRDENGVPRLSDGPLHDADSAIGMHNVYDSEITYAELPGDRAAGVLTSKVSWRPPAGVRQTIVYRRYLFPPEGYGERVKEASGFSTAAEAQNWGHASTWQPRAAGTVDAGNAAVLPPPGSPVVASPASLIERAAQSSRFAPTAGGAAPGAVPDSVRSGYGAAGAKANDAAPTSRLASALPAGQGGAGGAGAPGRASDTREGGAAPGVEGDAAGTAASARPGSGQVLGGSSFGTGESPYTFYGDSKTVEEMMGAGKAFAAQAGEAEAIESARSARQATRFLARAQVPADQWPDDVRPPATFAGAGGAPDGAACDGQCAAPPTRSVTATSGSERRALAPQYVPDGDYTYRLEATAPGHRVLGVYLLTKNGERYQLVAATERDPRSSWMEGDEVVETVALKDGAGAGVTVKRTGQRVYLIWTAGEPGEMKLSVRTLDVRDPSRTSSRATRAQLAGLQERLKLVSAAGAPEDDLTAALPGSRVPEADGSERVTVGRLSARGALTAETATVGAAAR